MSRARERQRRRLARDITAILGHLTRLGLFHKPTHDERALDAFIAALPPVLAARAVP